MLNNLPKPVVIGVTAVVVLLAIVVVFKTLTGKGENADRPTQAEMMEAQKSGKRTPPSPTSGMKRQSDPSAQMQRGGQ